MPNVGYLPDSSILVSEYKNLRSQCVFTLAQYVNDHKISSRVGGMFKEMTIEELSTYQDVSSGDGKRMATKKEDVKEIIGRSPDHSDTWIMRMYFEIMNNALPIKPEQQQAVAKKLLEQFDKRAYSSNRNSTR